MNTRLTAILLVAACSGLVQAQIAVPPSAPIEPTKPYTPPPTPAIKEVPVQPTTPPAPVELPNLPYESLAKKGADGKLVQLKEPVEWAALRVNPTIQSPEDKAKVKLILDERLRQYEMIVIDNIDFMEDIDNGMLKDFNPTAPDSKPKIIKIRALAGKGTLIKSLNESKALSDMQIRFNKKISDERIKAEYEAEKPAKAAEAKPGDDKNGDKNGDKKDDKKDKANSVGDAVILQAIAEAMHARRALFIDAAGKIGALGEKHGMAADSIKKISDAKTDDEKFETVRAGVKLLPVEKKREFLKAVLGV